MPRKGRIVVPGLPHHVTQRGNYKQKVFETNNDYRKYLFLMKERANRYEVEIISYCLMFNHVHFIVVPKNQDSMSKLFRDVHAFYSRYKNNFKDRKGHLWQGRYYSCVMSDTHLYQTIRYVEMNPVRAKIVDDPADYIWSSVRGHLGIEKVPIIRTKDIRFYGEKLNKSKSWLSYLMDQDEESTKEIRKITKKGSIYGNKDFVASLEKELVLGN